MTYYDGVWDHYLDILINDICETGFTRKEAEDLLRKLHKANLIIDERKLGLLPFEVPPEWRKK